MESDDDLASERAHLYFVRIIETRAAVGLFVSSWGGLELLLPCSIDVRLCEAARLEVAAVVLFPDAPRFRDQAAAEGYAHRCTLTEGLAQALFDDDGREWGTPLEFEPLYRPLDIDAMIADWSDADLHTQWSEYEGFRSPSGDDGALCPTGLAIQAEMRRRGLPLG